MHYLLFYDYSADYIERRPQYRGEHLRAAWAAVERGELVLAGALDQPPDAAVFVWNVESTEVIERFVADDPYVKNGLVTGWRVRPWHTVVGELATNPVRPGG